MAATMQKSPRKRPTSSHIAGPKPKKLHLEGPAETKSAKRTIPVTRPLIEEDDGDSEGASDVDEEDPEEDEPLEDSMLVDEIPVKNLSCMLLFFQYVSII